MVTKERGRGLLLFSAGLVAAVVLTATGCTGENATSTDPDAGDASQGGLVEKQVEVDGSTLNYAEGPDNGPPLLLIHGQLTDWRTWSLALPELTRKYHVFAIDVFGHGRSAHVPEKYTAKALSAGMGQFLTKVVGEPATVVGHSSGGLIAADLAANSPDQVRGVVLEDAPFFSSVLPRAKKTSNYVDLSTTAHNFLRSGETDFTTYYLQHTPMWDVLPQGVRDQVKGQMLAYRQANPDKPPTLPNMPAEFTELFRAMPSYDPRFGEAFYDNTFHRDFDHAHTLARITVPAILIHTNWSFDDKGVLLGAMSGEDAERVRSLLTGGEFIKVDSGHSFHSEKADQFTQIVLDFEQRVRS